MGRGAPIGSAARIPIERIIKMNRDDVINKVFPHALFGYDPVAVDAFLDEVIREFDRMTNTIDVLQFRLAQELSEARVHNDVLNAELVRTSFELRAGQLLHSGQEPAASSSADKLSETKEPTGDKKRPSDEERLAEADEEAHNSGLMERPPEVEKESGEPVRSGRKKKSRNKNRQNKA